MKHFTTALVLLLVTAPAFAVEIDFATKLVDLDGNQYKDCVKPKPNPIPGAVDGGCFEYLEHTLGLISMAALDRPEQNGSVSVMEQARRAVLARKVYPGRGEKHLVDLSGPEVTLLVDQIAKMNLRPVEFLRVLELVDPARLKTAN